MADPDFHAAQRNDDSAPPTLEGAEWSSSSTPQAIADAAPPEPARFAPMGAWQIIGRSFGLLASNPRRVLIAGVLIPFLISGTAAVASQLTLVAAEHAEYRPEHLSLLLLSFVVTMVELVLSLVVPTVAQAYVLMSFREAVLGNRASNSTIFSGLREVWGGLILWVLILTGAGAAVAIVAVVLVFLFLLATVVFSGDASSSSAPSAVWSGLVILLALICIPVVWLSIRVALTPAVIVLDRMRLGAAIRESWRLTRGRGGRVFGVFFTLGSAHLIVSLLALIVCIFAAAAVMGAVYFEMFGPFEHWTLVLMFPVVQAFLAAISVAVTANATGLLTVDARMRDGWLAGSLNGYAAARDAGFASYALPDPFVSPPEAFASPGAAPAAARPDPGSHTTTSG